MAKLSLEYDGYHNFPGLSISNLIIEDTYFNSSVGILFPLPQTEWRTLQENIIPITFQNFSVAGNTARQEIVDVKFLCLLERRKEKEETILLFHSIKSINIENLCSMIIVNSNPWIPAYTSMVENLIFRPMTICMLLEAQRKMNKKNLCR